MENGASRAEARDAIEAGKVCFVAGTLVHTKDGEKKIEEIKAGDEVLSYDTATHQFEYKEVVRTFERYSEEVLSVKIAGETEPLGVTPEHPFYVRVHGARSSLEGDDEEGEWKAAKNLQAGDEVLQAVGSWAFVESVEIREGGAKVYNFEVADNHNYFVGENGALVHNECKRPDGYRTGDIDEHGNLSPQVNRFSGHTNTRENQFVQSHHIIQDEWARANITGYNRNSAPAILLRSSSGEAHAIISARQRMRRNARVTSGETAWTSTSLRQEFSNSFGDLTAAGLSPKEVKRAIRKAYKHFDFLGGF